MIILYRAISFIIGYFIGCVSPSYFIAKSKGINIKEEGSGNAGATNTLRVLGTKAGIIVFVLDILKAVIACVLCQLLFSVLGAQEGNTMLFLVYVSFGVVIGHCFPFYLHFDGGKGVSATLGAMLVVDWRIALVAFAIFVIVVLLTKYISLGSMVAAIVYFVGFALMASNNKLLLGDHVIESTIIVGIIMLLLIFNHRSNIKRLIAGNENKFGSKKE